METKNDNLPTIRKIARIRDDATGQYTEIVEFPVSETATARLELAPALIHDPRQFAEKLWNAGAILPEDDTMRKKLLQAVADSEAPKEWVYAAETGWLNDQCSVFIKSNGVIGSPDTTIIGVNPNRDVDDKGGRLSVAGTQRTWKFSVAEKARLSSIFMFAICVALAAPLLRIMERQSFGICIVGRTRIGKTIATLFGASARGIARAGDLISWNLTEDRLEQRLVEYNDSIFPIDDLNKMRGSDRDRYERIENIAYLIEQGHQKGRHSSFAKAHGAAQSWRVILLTSHERSIAEIARKLKQERREGAAVRLSDMPGKLDGLNHIFDRLRRPMDGPTFKRWRDKQFAAIARACAENHGAVFERYIDLLITNGREKVRKFVLKQTETFANKVAEEIDGDIARDVARNFGVIYSGGMVGIKLRILPWTTEELFDAIAKCYRAARDLLPDDGVVLRAGIKALKARLSELPASDRPGREYYEKIDGYRKAGPAAIRCLIKCDAFNSTFASAHQCELVLDWLVQKHRITLATPKAAPVGSKAKPMGQHTWPDGVRRRSYEIRLPRRSKTINPGSKRREH